MGERDQSAGPFVSSEAAAGEPVATFSPEPTGTSVRSTPVSTWRPPYVIGDRFDSVQVIGSGGMGHVYRAWDKKLRRRVALKFILEPDAHARDRFLREVHATAQFEHPNVVRIYDVMEWGDLPFIVMEFLSGKTLHEIEKPMEWQRALQLGVALARGLAAVHRVGVVHRDIKPRNVMLTDDGEVKLCDFGLAKFARRSLALNTPAAEVFVRASSSPAPATLRTRTFEDDAAANTEPQVLTDSGILIGTPGFIAPESWGREATPRSDVYSTGAVLFELCTGRAVYPDVPRHALWATVQEHDAPLVTEVVPGVHPGFAELIALCLSRDPYARYASGSELHHALQELQDRPISGGSSTRGSHLMITPPSMAWREIGSLLVSVISAEAPADDEWRTYIDVCRRKVEEGTIKVLAVTAGGVPTRQQRTALRGLLAMGPVPAAVVSDAVNVHPIVTELHWRNPEISEFSSLDEALRYLCIDGPTAIDVQRQVAEMQHEVA